MIYKQWTEVHSEIINENKEQVIRSLIHSMLNNIPIDELSELFNVKEHELSQDSLYMYGRTAIQAEINTPFTEYELKIKKELQKQINNEQTISTNATYPKL